MGFHYKGPQSLQWTRPADTGADARQTALTSAVLVYRDTILAGAAPAAALDAAVQWFETATGDPDRAASRAAIDALIRQSQRQFGGWFWRLSRFDL